MGFNDYILYSIPCPCRNCKNRTPECHSLCNLYAQYKEDYAAIKQKEIDIKNTDRLAAPLKQRSRRRS